MIDLLKIVTLYGLVWRVTGCRDTLWFQASTIPAGDGPLVGDTTANTDSSEKGQSEFLSNSSRSVDDVKECARLCYVKLAPHCGSAVFVPQGSSASGWCQPLPVNHPCTEQRPLVASITNRRHENSRILLHCFYCHRFARERIWTSSERKMDSERKTESERKLDTTTERTTSGTVAQRSEPGNETVSSTPTGKREEKEIRSSVEKKEDEARSIIQPIRMMTFNTWISGSHVNDGVNKIARHIFIIDPDIVGLQEMDGYTVQAILDALSTLYKQSRPSSSTWYHCAGGYYGLNHLLSRFPITKEHDASKHLKNNGCQVRIHDQPARYADVWNVHLNWEDYGPYAACNASTNTASLRELNDRLFASEYKPFSPATSRLHQTLRFLHTKVVKEGQEEVPLPLTFVLGDFNSPSHLDWTTSASTLHCNITYDWPISKLMADFGFRDSFRIANPNPIDVPGFTWSPIYKTKTWLSADSSVIEPQDRIDFIYYAAANKDVSVKQSFVYWGSAEVRQFPFHQDNQWPSDHAAVVTDFLFIE